MRPRETGIVDPEDAEAMVRGAIASVGRGEHTGLRSQRELRQFFSDIVERVKSLLAKKRRAKRR